MRGAEWGDAHLLGRGGRHLRFLISVGGFDVGSDFDFELKVHDVTSNNECDAAAVVQSLPYRECGATHRSFFLLNLRISFFQALSRWNRTGLPSGEDSTGENAGIARLLVGARAKCFLACCNVVGNSLGMLYELILVDIHVQ